MRVRITNISGRELHLPGIYQTFLEPLEVIEVERESIDLQGDLILKEKIDSGEITLLVVPEPLDLVLNFSSGQLTRIDTVNPTVNDDLDSGFNIGSRWFNTATDREYACLDATVGAAVWIATSGSGGPPSGPAGGDLSGTYPDPEVAAITTPLGPTQLVIGSIEDNTLLQRVGGTLVGGPRWFGALGADPGGSVSAGDSYFNTSLGQRMSYDSGRGKWLSDADVPPLYAGRDGNTAAGNYYRGADGLTQSATKGWEMPYNGTITALAYTRDSAVAATFEVTANGSTIASLASASVAGSTASLNADFSAGDVIAFRNAAGGATTRDVHVWAQAKWRA